MYLKNLFLKPMGVLCFLTFVACEDNNITSDIENVEEGILYESDELGEMTRKASVAEIKARADEQYHKSMNLRKNRVAAATSIPHWVGVLSATGGCPAGVPNISYYMDCTWEQSVQGCGGGNELGTSGGGVDHGLTGAESEF